MQKELDYFENAATATGTKKKVENLTAGKGSVDDQLSSIGPLSENSKDGDKDSSRRASEAVLPPEQKNKSQVKAVTLGAGLVTFTSLRAQVTACSIKVLSAKYPDMVTSPAPNNKEIYWKNFATPPDYILYSTGLSRVGYYVGILFWAVIITAINALSNIDNITDYLPFIELLPMGVLTLLRVFLPVIILGLFLNLLPVIFDWVSRNFERRKTESDIQKQVFGW